MNENLNNIINVSDFKKEFLIEIAELYENVEQINDKQFEKQEAIKFFMNLFYINMKNKALMI